MSVLTVDDVATDADLIARYKNVTAAMPTSSDRDSRRQQALNDVESYLLQRSPRVHPTALVDLTELKQAVVLRALQLICQEAITAEGDVFWVQWKAFRDEFRQEINRTYSVNSDGAQSPPMTISVYRG